MKMKLALFLLLPLLLTGCFLDSPVNVRDAQTKVERLEQELVNSRTLVDALATQLEDAKRIAEQTGHADAIRAVSLLSDAVAKAKTVVEKVEAEVPKAKELVAKLQEQGDTVPAWKVGIGALLTFVLPKVITLVPGVGPFAAPLAKLTSNVAWALLGTKEQKREDERNAIAAAALPVEEAARDQAETALRQQVAFAHSLLSGVPAQKAKDDARADQEDAGTHALIKSMVRSVEKEAREAVGAARAGSTG